MYLKSRGTIEPVKMAGRRGMGWRLTESTGELERTNLNSPQKRPEPTLSARERTKLIAILADAGRALGTAEVARRLLTLNNEEITGARVKRAVSSVRVWLVGLRDDKIVRSTKSPNGNELSWELSNCCDEIASEFAARERKNSDQVQVANP
jgi:hypothetical protein